jgi:hypothetical protein
VASVTFRKVTFKPTSVSVVTFFYHKVPLHMSRPCFLCIILIYQLHVQLYTIAVFFPSPLHKLRTISTGDQEGSGESSDLYATHIFVFPYTGEFPLSVWILSLWISQHTVIKLI